MDATPALIMTQGELQNILDETAQKAAHFAIEQLRDELQTDPDKRLVQQLREYILNPETLENPREHWASGPHIRAIELGNKGTAKSIAWFHQFKQKSGLKACFHRRSKRHGHLQEWCFEDIRLCWPNLL